MDIDKATEIVRVMCQTQRKIEAIKLLRYDTGMGLTEAKNYLEVYSKDGNDQDSLLKQLCQDFVNSKQDLLVLAVKEQRYWNERVAELTREISEEEQVTQTKEQ
jgi:hypothetical protein